MKAEMNSHLFRRVTLCVACGTTALALTGCYVVPIQQLPPSAPQTVYVPLAPPAPVTFAARLYPANEAAAEFGMQQAVVTNDLNGRGHFSVNIRGEQFSGEATRVAGSQREGFANAAGNRGGMLNCRYTMNQAALGTGICVLNNGPLFTMHFG
jgi:hypothetical protein